MRPHDLLLIALLPNPIDLERAHMGWYRIPESYAPAALLKAKALAFYQPASFGTQRWQVAWWGMILELDTLLRRELLPDEPHHRRANEMYVRVRLSSLVPMKPPKRAKKGRRLLFVPTPWQIFQQAESLDDLFVPAHRPIADDPLYKIIQQQIDGKRGIPDPHTTHQKRLFDSSTFDYEILDW